MHSCVHNLGHNDQQGKLTDMHIQFSLADMSIPQSRDYMARHLNNCISIDSSSHNDQVYMEYHIYCLSILVNIRRVPIHYYMILSNFRIGISGDTFCPKDQNHMVRHIDHRYNQVDKYNFQRHRIYHRLDSRRRQSSPHQSDPINIYIITFQRRTDSHIELFQIGSQVIKELKHYFNKNT